MWNPLKVMWNPLKVMWNPLKLMWNPPALRAGLAWIIEAIDNIGLQPLEHRMLIVQDNRPRFLSRADYDYAKSAVAAALERCGVLPTWQAIQEHPDNRSLLDAFAWIYVAPNIYDPGDFEIRHYDTGVSETVHGIDFCDCRHYARVRQLAGLYSLQGWESEAPSHCSHNLGWLLPSMRWVADVVGARVALMAAKEELMDL